MDVKKILHFLQRNIWIIILVGGMILYPFVSYQPYWLSLLITIFIFAAFALSYDLLLGFTGLISFGHALFFGLGAYSIAIFSRFTELSFGSMFILLAVAATAIALIKTAFAMRVRGIYFAMITLALAQFFWVLVMTLSRYTGGEDGMPRVPRPVFLDDRLNYYFFALGFLLLVYLISRRFINSPTGRVLIGIRENEERMVMLGYNVFKYKLFSLTLAGIIGSFSGAIYVMFINIAYPALLNIQSTIDVLMMTIVGGVGTLHGPIFGAALVRLLSHFLSSHFRQWIIIFGIIYILIVVFMPLGIFGGIPGFSKWLEKRGGWLKWIAQKLKP